MLIVKDLSYIRCLTYMCPTKKYKQLRFSLESTRYYYHHLPLRFRIGRKVIEGVLHGDCADWYFISDSPAFVQTVPGGKLRKYMLWIDMVPKNIGQVYNAITEAAVLAGYTMQERDEAL